MNSKATFVKVCYFLTFDFLRHGFTATRERGLVIFHLHKYSKKDGKFNFPKLKRVLRLWDF